MNSVNKFFDKNILEKFKNKNVQLIIANNVIAHVKNVNEFVKTLSVITNNKTIITIEFPYVYNLKIKNQFDTIYHEHHYYYSLNSISKLLNRHNLEIFDVDKIPIHGGSFRIYVKNKNSKIKLSNKYKTNLSLKIKFN